MGFPNKYYPKPKSLGSFLIIYGILYILIDRFDFLKQSFIDANILANIHPESMTMRIVNVIFCLSLALGGYFLTLKRREAWYFINFASIGILTKYVYTFIFSFSFYGNFFTRFGVHFIIAIICLLLINSINYKDVLKFKDNKPKSIYGLFTVISLFIVIFFGFESSFWYMFINYNKKHYKEVVYETNDFAKPDTCYFANDFCLLIDTLQDIKQYTSLMIVQIDADSIPIYAEELHKYEWDVKSHYFQYNLHNQKLTLIRESYYWDKEMDTLIFDYNRTKDLLELPKREISDNSYSTDHFRHNSASQLMKISSIYNSNSKNLEEKTITIFTNKKLPELRYSYCTHRPWYVFKFF